MTLSCMDYVYKTISKYETVSSVLIYIQQVFEYGT